MAASAGGSVIVSIGAAFASTFRSTFGSAENQISELGSTVRTLDSKLTSIKGFRRMQSETMDAEAAWRNANAELRAMSQHLAGLGSITDRQASEFRALERRTATLKNTFENSRASVDRMGNELRAAGVDTSALATEQQGLERQLATTTNSMRAMAGIANSGVGQAFGRVNDQMKSLAAQAVVAGAGLGYLFKTNFVDVASQFEKFKTILETTEGSSAGAEKAMKWVSDFSAKTPYELAEVTDGFVKLRAYGLNPTNGLLQTLGDTSAAMGKPLMMAVEAIADAITGENERLKEFGIKGAKEGGKIIYEYTNKAGKQQKKIVDANNRAAIEATLSAIWNEKYSGAMGKLSGTWEGMVSNIKDQWTRFTNTVMQAGLFDWMKGKLGGALEQLNALAADGTLQKWAETAGAQLAEMAKGAWALGSAMGGVTIFVKDLVGGWENLAYIFVGIKLAPLIVSMGSLALSLGSAFGSVMMLVTGTGSLLAAFKVLSAFLLANPIGIAIGLLGAAAFLLWKNWDGVKGGLTIIGHQIVDGFVWAIDTVTAKFGVFSAWLASKTQWIFSTIEAVKSVASGIGEGIGGAWSKARGLVGAGSETAPLSSSTGAASPAAVPIAAPRSGDTHSTTVQAPITINGATDPAATAKAVAAELDRREREARAANRGKLIDAVGY